MSFRIPLLRVEEVGEKAESGATEPFFCRLSDDNLYLVKGRAALPRGLISEVVCAVLGRAYGLPIPEIALAELGAPLLDFNPAARASLGPGTVFASRYRENLIQVGRDALDRGDRLMLRQLFLFDYWVRNADRTGTVFGGNSNLFMSVSSGDLVVIDHNLAFDRNFDVDQFVSLHVCKDFWFSYGRLDLDRASLLDCMSKAHSELAGIDRILPESWTEAEPDLLEEIDLVLSARNHDQFWDVLL